MRTTSSIGDFRRLMACARRQARQRIGARLIQTCNRFPHLKPRLSPVGLRAPEGACVNGAVTAQLHDGESIALTHLGDNHLSFRLFWLGTDHYEPVTTMVMDEVVQPSDTFLDVGANIGFFSLVMARLKPRLRIVAFEPNPKVFAILRANVSANRFSTIDCSPLALSDSTGTALLYLSDSDLSASLRSDFDYNQSPPIEIQTARLDDVLRRDFISGNLVIKVDVEGHEEAFFVGARNVICSFRPEIITEVAIKYKRNPFGFLENHGYRFYSITPDGLEETRTPEPAIRGKFFFPNYLFSTRPREEIALLFRRVQPKIAKLDLTRTSNCFGLDTTPVARVEGP